MTDKPILCVDFDGVIHSYSSGWQGACNIPDPPVAGALSWLWNASRFWQICVYSSRSKEDGAIVAMQSWFRRHADDHLFGQCSTDDLMGVLSFPTQKPAANLTIDDRAICFDGNWAALNPQTLLNFKPWNKRQKDKSFHEMTDDELLAEYRKWKEKTDGANAWGAAYGVALGWRQRCFILLRERGVQIDG